MSRLLIALSDLEAIERQAVDALPEECCGLLIGSQDSQGNVRVTELVTCRNDHSRPRRRFTIATEALLAAYRRAREQAEDVVGSYHSHPDSAAVPSSRDRAGAVWPGSSCLILSVAGRTVRERRSWRLGGGEGGFVEEEVVVQGSGVAGGGRT